jgi:importin subunit alpha-1
MISSQAFRNMASKGTDAQIRYFARQGVIPRLCDLFNCPDSKIIMVAMEGVENILRVGKTDAGGQRSENGYADEVLHCIDPDLLKALQQHQCPHIGAKADQICKVI